MNDAKKMTAVAYDALDEKKGENLSIIDISGISPIADYFVIATANSNSQIHALVDHVDEKMFQAGYQLKQREGGNNSPWVLLDYTDVIVHIFDRENRSFYNLDHIWKDGIEVERERL